MPLKNKMNYLDNDIMVLEELTKIPGHPLDAIFRIKFFLLVVCEEGELSIHINGTPYVMKKNDIMLVLPTMLLNNAKRSEDNNIRMIGFSVNFLNRVIKKDRNMERVFYSVYKNPIRTTDGKDHSHLLHHYVALIMDKIEDTEHYYRHDILQHLFAAIFCELLNNLKKHLGDAEDSPERGLRRAHQVFKYFLAELSKDGGMHRSVNYFADRLCYSPKYISSVVKQISGRTALSWINEYAMEQIKTELKYSDKSIKEIADHFNFANQSFFGKYVKAHVGMSPARYRNTGEE
ncbi:MAG: AraC family transcriptional regulator [Bacteroides sp.]|nr:AraC family transcriptional regulator [Bacteroides sp.]